MSKQTDLNQQCQHISPRGQRCRMLRASDHNSFCTHHLRQASAAQPDTEALAAELLGSLKNFSTVDSVNHLLGNLVIQLARKRIERRDAIALAYICQLLLNSLSPLKKELRGLDIPADPDAEAQAFFAELRASMRASAAAASQPDQAGVPSPVPHRSAKDAPSSAPGPAAPPQPQPRAPEPPRDYYSLRT